MQRYAPTDDEMSDMMSQRQPPGAKRGQPEADDQEDQSPNSAIVPLALLGQDVREGDTVTLRVAKIYGDEAEIEPAEQEKGPSESGQASPDQELDSMDQTSMTP